MAVLPWIDEWKSYYSLAFVKKSPVEAPVIQFGHCMYPVTFTTSHMLFILVEVQ